MNGLAVDFTARRGDFTLKATFDAEPGSVIGVIGPNGAGKSTLFAGLAGLIAVTGTIRWRGRELQQLPASNRNVGLVFQDYLLFPKMTVLDNVAFGPRCRGARRREANQAAYAELSHAGLTEFADRRPDQLSGGQAQRVAVARALAVKPELLLLDEPLAALDATARVTVRAALRQTLQQFDGVSLIISHDVLDILALVDHVLVLQDGEVAQFATPQQLIAAPATEFAAAFVGPAITN